MTEIDAEFLEIFLDEADDLLEGWESNLLQIESNPTIDGLDALFRVAHNLKGSSRAVGLLEFGDFVHVIEDVIGKLKTCPEAATGQIMSLLLDCQATLVRWSEGLRDSPSHVEEVTEFKNMLHEVHQRLENGETDFGDEDDSPDEAIDNENAEDEVQTEASSEDTDQAENHFAGDIAEEQAKVNAAEEAEETEAGLANAHFAGDIAAEEAKVAEELAKTDLEEADDGAANAMAHFAGDLEAEQAKVMEAQADEDAKKKEEAQKQAAEAKPAATPQTAAPANTSETKPAADAKAKEADKKKQRDETIRVSSRKLDELLRAAGELAIQNEILSHCIRTSQTESELFQSAMSALSKGVKNIQRHSMNLRMQSVETLFQRIERTARDVARKQGKKINFVTTGADVELDKKVIELIKDPLVHIIRNAIDHGVEDNDKRVEVGKPEVATVHLGAINRSDGVRITISDDGGGINSERVRKKAIEKGIIDSNAALDSYQINNLILMPGFSTAETVTDISGRGVGMDVVKQTTEDLGGKIDVDSKFGHGTTFHMDLPLSLAVIDALLIRIAGENFVVPINEVHEVIDLNDMKIQGSDQELRFDLRGRVVQLENIVDYLPHHIKKEKGKIDAQDNHRALLARHNDREVAFSIDAIDGQQAVVVQPLKGKLNDLPGISGSTILRDGSPGLILDLGAIARLFLQRSERKKVA